MITTQKIINPIHILRVLTVIILLTIVKNSYGQASKYLSGTLANNEVVQEHIRALKLKAKDSTNQQPLIPLSVAKTSTTTLNTHFPYPVIMVHGLDGSLDTWLTLYTSFISKGWSYGGAINFCLNSDGDNAIANLTSDIIDFTTNTTLTNADFYIVNFNTDPNGTTYGANADNSVLSNQAAVYKQAVAMQKAIAHVLTVSGKDKVIILSHSMGGLATRQYIQNNSLWQPDGAHHVAKLNMIATPNGGSNLTGTFAFSGFLALDEKSDAVRDLRRSYSQSGNQGVFLFAGIEDLNYMDDALFYNFYNDDVNCNNIHGETIVGLNQKIMPTDLDFGMGIGDWSYDPTGTGDGVVDVADAQIKNFYPTLLSETFIRNENHTDLKDDVNLIFLVIDEPDANNLGYTIQKDTLYDGYITTQATDGIAVIDYDQYCFKMESAGTINISLDNFITAFDIKITGAGNTILFTQSYAASTATTTNLALPIGSYSLQISATPSDTSWLYPYSYMINTIPSITTHIESSLIISKIIMYPNPSNNSINITYANLQHLNTELKITDLLGNTLTTMYSSDTSINQTIDLSSYADGTYIVSLKNSEQVTTAKFVKLSN